MNSNFGTVLYIIYNIIFFKQKKRAGCDPPYVSKNPAAAGCMYLYGTSSYFLAGWERDNIHKGVAGSDEILGTEPHRG